MEYTVYDIETGLIHSHGSSQGLTDLNDILLNSGDGIIEGYHDRLQYKIINGVPTEYTPDINPVVRTIRNGLLEDSDWTQSPDSPLTTEKKTEWATYRQALRDVPATNSSVTDIDSVVWPTKPQ
tara:strand:- start:3145 stop:3516 length:372 start_codon:yes stop_codon:yes gene_type:complete